jgi:hypothetical protein
MNGIVRLLIVSAIALAIVFPSSARAQTRFSVEVFGGTAFSLPSGLTLEQDGEEDLEFTGHYETRPFEQPVYWMVRLGLRRPTSRPDLPQSQRPGTAASLAVVSRTAKP